MLRRAVDSCLLFGGMSPAQRDVVINTMLPHRLGLGLGLGLNPNPNPDPDPSPSPDPDPGPDLTASARATA